MKDIYTEPETVKVQKGTLRERDFIERGRSGDARFWDRQEILGQVYHEGSFSEGTIVTLQNRKET